MYNKSVMEPTSSSPPEPSKPVTPAPIVDVAPPVKPADPPVVPPPPEAEHEGEYPAAPLALSRPAKTRPAHALPLGPLVLAIIIFIGLATIAYLAYSRHG